MNINLFFISIFFLFTPQLLCQTTCDYELILVSNAMGNFNSQAYSPPITARMFDRLNSLRATILATYQLCKNKMIIDPDSLYPQDKSECLMGLYNVSLLSPQYTGNPTKILNDLDKLAKTIFSTQNNCRPILYYNTSDNVSDQCKKQLGDFDQVLVEYGQEIILGRNGTKYFDNMTIQVEGLRKVCGFDILTKPRAWNNDTCKTANIEWLYPITDQYDTSISTQFYKKAMTDFYLIYQSIYRARNLCIPQNEEILLDTEKETSLRIE